MDSGRTRCLRDSIYIIFFDIKLAEIFGRIPGLDILVYL